MNLVDTVSDVEVNEVYGVKRGREPGSTTGDGGVKKVASGTGVPVVAPSLPLAAGVVGSGAVGSVPVGAGLVAPTKEKKAKKRAKARRLPVPTRVLNIWETLSRVNAGLSMLDWVAIDPNAAQDLADGVRDLKIQRPKRRRRHLMALPGVRGGGESGGASGGASTLR